MKGIVSRNTSVIQKLELWNIIITVIRPPINLIRKRKKIVRGIT